MDAFTIKDLENLTGIKAHTIRIWEQRYSFLKPQRTGTNIRYYTNEELKILLNVALLNKYGFKISHISRMGAELINDKIVSLTQAGAMQERIINDLLTCMLDLRVEEFEEVTNNYINASGIEKTIFNIIFPFLEKIGILWHAGRAMPGQEHLVSNIIRQKLIVGIDSAYANLKLNKTALLFLPEDEHHEIGLLYMHYQFKMRGYTVIYLGADTPLQDVQHIAKHKKPDFIYSHIISTPANFNFDKFLANYAAFVEGTPLIISGKYAVNYKKSLPSCVHLKQSPADVIACAGSL